MRSKENKWESIYINKDIYQNIFTMITLSPLKHTDGFVDR